MSDGKRSILSKPWMVAILATVSCALWGSAFAFVKVGYAAFGIAADAPAQQILFAGLRFSLAGLLVIAGVSVARRRLALPTRADAKPIALLSLCQTFLQYAPFYVGLAHARGINASLVEGTSAFVSMAIAAIVFRQERLSTRKLAGCLLGFGGVALVTLRGGGELGTFSVLGEGLIVLSLVAVACSACLMRRYGSGHDPIVLSGWQFLLGGATLSVVGLLLGGRLEAPTPQAIAVLCYLGALSAVAYSIWALLLKHNPVSHVAVYEFLIPICGVVCSATFLGEALPAAQVPLVAAALALVVAGTLLVNSDSDDGLH